MMDYAQQQRKGNKHLIGFVAVVLLHVLIVWALMSGLGKKAYQIIKKPVEVMLEEWLGRKK